MTLSARTNASLAALGAACATLLTLCYPSTASAYCRTAICANATSGLLCSPERASDCGTGLFWRDNCLGFSIHEAASKQVDLATAQDLMSQAFASWQNADCGGGAKPSLSVEMLETVSCDRLEYNENAGNSNAVIFREDGWDHPGSSNAVALTTITFDLNTGEIFDADLEINANPAVVLTTGDADPEYDLASIMAHEAGHILGLAHSQFQEATMFATYLPGETHLRDLSADDIAGICATFPPGTSTANCDPTPRHGFSAECATSAPVEAEGCRYGGGPSRYGSFIWTTLALYGALFLRPRRRKGRAWTTSNSSPIAVRSKN